MPDSREGSVVPLEVLGQALALAVQWNDDEHKTPTPANLIAVQVSPEGVILTFGYAGPPLLSGPPEVQREKLASMSEVVAIPHTKILLTFDRFRELAGIVAQSVTVVEANMKNLQSGGGVKE